MTQKERMMAGLIYDPGDEKILREQYPYLGRLKEFNDLPVDAEKERDAWMKEMFADCGEGCFIQPPFYASGGCGKSLPRTEAYRGEGSENFFPG